MNNVSITGRLSSDVTFKEISADFKTANFTIAVDRPYKTKSGEKQTDFIPCVATNQKAEILKKYFRKGSRIAITGEIHTRNYEKEGKKIYVTEVSVNSVEFLENKTFSEVDKLEKVGEGAADKKFYDDSDSNVLPFDL